MRAAVNGQQRGYGTVTALFRVLEVSLIMPGVPTPEERFVLKFAHQNARFAISFPNRDMSKLTVKVRHVDLVERAPLGNHFEIFISENPPVFQVV